MKEKVRINFKRKIEIKQKTKRKRNWIEKKLSE